MSSFSTAQKILIGASALLIIDLFLPWNKFCADFGGGSVCASANGWHQFGILAGLLALALIVFEGAAAMGNEILKGSNKGTIILACAVGVLISVVLRVIMNLDGAAFGAWLGIVLGLAVAYGGWMRYQEAPSTGTTTTTPPAA
jgi:hypothetical protein